MERKDLYRRRLRVLGVIGLLLWCALVGRLYYLQVYSHDELSAAAVGQYQVVVEGLDTRGVIWDRYMQPLTGGTAQYYYFLPTAREDAGTADLLAAIGSRKVSAGGGGKYNVYRSQFFDEAVSEKLKTQYGAYVLCCPSRYSDQQPACHLIGYLNQAEKRGVSGLELLCENRLKATDNHLTLWADSGGSLLLGIAPAREGKTAEQITENALQTTIDKSLQIFCENALAEQGIKGAVIVSHAETGQILAMASAPVFNPNQIEDYLQSSSDCLVDRTIQGSYAPGSVFKIVVAAAALEQGIWEEDALYTCEGETEIEGISLGCTLGPKEGHGKVDLAEAMAKSCNCYFATMGDAVGYEAILEMAEKLGFGREVLRGFPGEACGNLPKIGEAGQWDITNLSIGQGEILATPMQIQRLMSVVAQDGIDSAQAALKVLPAGAVTETMEDGEYRGEESSGQRRVFSPETARALRKMLGDVMHEGTGSGPDYGLPVFGKTGTAEAVSAGGQMVHHGWFSGWCELSGQRYVVTVLAESAAAGSASALPVFSAITDYLQAKNYTLTQASLR